MRNNRTNRVLITDSNELAGLGSVRSLGRAGYRLTLASSERTTSNATRWSRYAHASLTYPDPWKRQSAFAEWLADAANSGKWDVILPNSEAAIIAAARVRAGGSKSLIIAPADHLLPYTLSKFAATEAAKADGILTPQTTFVAADAPESEIRALLAASRYPLILKTDNSVGPDGEYRKGNTYIVQTDEEALYLLPEIRAEGNRFLIQEQVGGFGVGAFLLVRNGQTLLRFAHRRLHEVPYTGGYSSYRASTDDPEALAISERLLSRIGYDGAAMVEFRRDPQTGQTYFLEINGRLWGSIALALHAGVDFPRRLVETALDPPLQSASVAAQPPYPIGLRCRHTPGEIAHVLSILKARASDGVGRERKLAAIGEFIRLSLNPAIRHDHFWWSDPLPGSYQAWDSFRFLVRRIAEAIGGKLSARRRNKALAVAVAEQRARARQLEPASSVVFLCYGNICRSPFAEHYWNHVLRAAHPELPVAISAGFHARTGRGTPIKIADFVRREFDLDLAGHRSQRVSAGMMQSADAVLIMDRENFEALSRDYPEAARRKAFLLGLFGEGSRIEIEDPFLLKDPHRVREAYRQLKSALEGFARALGAQGAGKSVPPAVRAGE
jgi:protein-tyrosine-phosphatase/predicted ATP-grasp superfamily ATP-dependent carboligase